MNADRKGGPTKMPATPKFDDKADSYSTGELRSHLSSVLSRARMRNEEIPISSHGDTVAGIVSMYDVRLLKFMKEKFGREEIEGFERQLEQIEQTGHDGAVAERAFEDLVKLKKRTKSTAPASSKRENERV